MISSEKVPILITRDVDPDKWMPVERRIQAMNRVRYICDEQGITAAFYLTAEAAEDYIYLMSDILGNGHEIGDHGLTPGEEEDYDRMPYEMQKDYIQRATQILQKTTQTPIRSFRSLRVKTFAETLRILNNYGYWSDSSVCSKRTDLISSNLINTG